MIVLVEVKGEEGVVLVVEKVPFRPEELEETEDAV